MLEELFVLRALILFYDE